MMAILLVALAAPPTLTHLHPAGARQGTSVTVTLGGTFERWPVGVWVEGAGVEAKADKVKGRVTITVAADAAPGPRWLRVHDVQGASAPRPFVVGTLPEVMEKEPNDDLKTAQMIEGDAVVNGRLEKAGDVDCFAVRLKKGQTLIASVMAERLGSPMDGVVQVVSAKGFVLAQNNDHAGLDPQAAYTAREDGPHFVRLFAFPAIPDASIRYAGGERFLYRLTLTTGGFIEHAWPLAVKRGSRPGLAGLGLAGVKAEHSGDTVWAKGVAGWGRVLPEDHECVERAEGVQRLTPPVTVSGRIAKSGERHLYEFDGKKGQRLDVRLDSASEGLALDGVIRLLGRDGKALARVQAAALRRDPEMAFTLPRDEAYRLEVSDHRGEGGTRHAYRLRVSCDPDFALSMAADRFTLTPGKPLDIPVTVTRRADFAGPVELRAEGLPAGVRSEMVSPATLRLHAEAKAAGGGAFRVIGRAKGLPERVARAAVVEPAGVIEWAWLASGR